MLEGQVGDWLRTTVFALQEPDNVDVSLAGVYGRSADVFRPPLLQESPEHEELTLERSDTLSPNWTLLREVPQRHNVGTVWPLCIPKPEGRTFSLVETPTSACVEFESIIPPEQILLPLFVLLETPGSVSILEPIGQPGSRGRSYMDDESSATLAETRQPELDLKTRCRHGLPTFMCDICRKEREQRSRSVHIDQDDPAKRQTVDVFEFLLPYLQPPAELVLRNHIFFPQDRQPHPFQYQGINFLRQRESALLGDEMGLGKTIQAIVALQVLVRTKKVRKALILCPRSVVSNWVRELNKWAPELIVQKVRGTQEERDFLWQVPRCMVYVTTYSTLRSDVERGVKFPDIDLTILDEIQYIKNPEAKRSRAVREIEATYRWGLSGTPLQGKLEDISAIFDYLHPDLFRSNETLYARKVRDRIEPYFLRRRVRDVRVDLPDKRDESIELELTPEQRRRYNDLYTEGRSRLSRSDAGRMHVFAWIQKLRQICDRDPETGRSCKREYLEESLETVVSNQKKALVFSEYARKILPLLKDELERFAPEVYHGSLNDTQREGLVQRYQEEEKPRVLLMSVKAGGVGLNLTRATYVYHYDHPWNPAVKHQAEGRACRIGNDADTVFVYHLYTINTIEERIRKVLESKQALFDNVIDSLTETEIKETVSDQELFGLFDLEPPQGSPDSGSLDDLDPRQFEKLVVELYRKMGYNAQITSYSRDGGVDIVARRNGEYGTETHIIECKHYPLGKVGPNPIRELAGVWHSRRGDADYAVLVTSGTFTSEAQREAESSHIHIMGRGLLECRLERHKIDIAQFLSQPTE
ncbi:MAG: SNF2-related protein [Anaerolineae bacterium]